MDPVTVVGRSRAVRGRADERVREIGLPSDGQQSGVRHGLGGGHVDVEAFGGTVEQEGIADRFGYRGEDEEVVAV